MAQDISDRAEELLTSEVLVAHLATCHDGRPHAAPLWYYYDDGTVEITTTGRKLRDIRENPRVAMSVQKDEDGVAQWGLTLRGTATVVDDADEEDAIFRRINEKYGADEDEWRENTAVHIEVGSVDYWEY